VAGLLGFAALYLGLIAWLARTCWRLVTSTAEPFIGGLLALPALFLLAFLVKGLFYVRREERKDAVELGPAEEPTLLAFVHRIADEAGAPRPHKVFLTPEVNAAVSYDISFWNLLLPSRKNLYVGLGLVNVLTLDELKAVLAHEFGHFAQRTMAVGSWVYVAGQAVGAVVERRDIFDRFLLGISRVDLRVAWIGWLMRLLVFAIRAVLETAFRGVVVLQRGLSREMEFQADLVSVSLSGSDSLIHALHRLPAADDALDRAGVFATGEARSERPVADLYAVQSRCLEGLRRLRGDPELGRVPARPPTDPASHRVFDADLAETPRMWATHPPSRDREENAKQRYVPSVLDGRPAWSLFADPEATKRAMTRKLLQANAPELAERPTAPPEETLARLDAQFGQRASEERYRGVYVGRSPVRWAATREDLYEALPEDRAAVTAALEATYPPELVGELKALRRAELHLAQLEALRRGLLQAAGGVLRFEGRVVPRAELPALIARVKEERDRLSGRLAAHDRAVRTAHRAAARALGGGWEAHLAGLGALLHCASHVGAEVEDANGFLGNVFAIVTADGNVSNREFTRLLEAAGELHRTLSGAYAAGRVLRPPDPAPEGADVAWASVFAEEFLLQEPTREGFAGNWFQATGTWVNASRNGMAGAADFALDALLQAEEHVARCHRDGTDPGPAPTPAVIPTHFATLVPGTERTRQEKLDWWDRFLLADGWGPGALRLGVAGAVLAPALFLTAQVGTRTVLVHNGLTVPVLVRFAESEPQRVAPGGHEEVTVPIDPVQVQATTDDGTPIESFQAEGGNAFSTIVYNVAGAGFILEERVGYGMDGGPPQLHGAVRWLETPAQDVFTDPPTTVKADGPTTRRHLLAVKGFAPHQLLSACPDDTCRSTLATAHVRFDDPADPDWDDWAVALNSFDPTAPALISERIATRPDDVRLGRLEMDIQIPDACARRLARAAEAPDNADAAYLAGRCREAAGEDGAAVFTPLAERFPEHPWVEWGMAWVAVEAGDLAGAEERLRRVRAQPPDLADEVWRAQLHLARLRGAPLEEQTALLPRDDSGEWTARLLRAEAEGDPGELGELEPQGAALLLLAAGRVADAGATLAGADGGGLGWLVAASDGADPALATAALGRGTEGIGVATVSPAVALAHRAGADASAILGGVLDPGGAVVPILAEAAGLTDDALLTRVSAVCADPLSATCRHLAIYAAVRLGERAPPELRARVKAITLPDERPYLR